MRIVAKVFTAAGHRCVTDERVQRGPIITTHNMFHVQHRLDLSSLTRRHLLHSSLGSVTGTITQLHLSRGVGALLGEDGKRYTFRRSDVREVWFHDLTEGARVAFEPAKNLSATHVRPVSTSL